MARQTARDLHVGRRTAQLGVVQHRRAGNSAFRDGSPASPRGRTTRRGYGTVHGAFASEFSLGQVIAVTDDDADTLAATVIAIRPGAADLQVHWGRVITPQP